MEEIESWALEPMVWKVEEEVAVGGEIRVCTLYKGEEYRTPPHRP